MSHRITDEELERNKRDWEASAKHVADSDQGSQWFHQVGYLLDGLEHDRGVIADLQHTLDQVRKIEHMEPCGYCGCDTIHRWVNDWNKCAVCGESH